MRIVYKYYKDKHPDRFKHTIGHNDGCLEQYKSRFAAFEMTFLCEDLGVDAYIQCFPPTAQFKGPSDAGGNDTKLNVKMLERALVLFVVPMDSRCFFALEKYMPKPVNNEKSRDKKIHITERHFRYVVKDERKTIEMAAHPHFVTLLNPQ